MKIHRIKHNYRYIIYEIKDDYYLVDLYDHWWLTILFPFLGWFLYHKAYLLSKEEFKDYCVTNKKKISPLSVGGISLVISPLIVAALEYPMYIYNFQMDGQIIHFTVFFILSVVLIFIYIKFNHIKTNRNNLYVKIFPFRWLSYVKGIMAYILFIFFGYGIFYFPLQATNFLLSIPFLLFSAFTFLYIVYIGYIYMENMGPYDYQFKNKEE